LATAKVQQIVNSRRTPQLDKTRTGITGFDEVTKGGLPKGRPSIVCGGPGCGKTMFAAECLVRGATQFGEPGVLMTFEGSEAVEAQLAALRASLADEEARVGSTIAEDEQRETRISQDAVDMANRRKSNSIEKRRARFAG